MSSLFLFGAGASFGSGPCWPYRPPLGKDLFPALQAEGGVAATVDADLANLFVEDFEAGMDRFWKERNADTTELLRDMARFFAPFSPSPGNYYGELLRVLGGSLKNSIMVTTNYDLMIERAVCDAGFHVQYGGFPAHEGNIPILKIHGSCNFLPDLQSQNMQIWGVKFNLSQAASGSSIIETGIRPAQHLEEIIHFCRSEDAIAPALAVYSPSKQVLFCSKIIQEYQRAWVNALSKVTRIYVIGLRVHLVDEHIWGPLSKSKTPIYYVGLEPEDFLEWARKSNRRHAYDLAKSFEEAIPKIAQHHSYKKKTVNKAHPIT